LEAAFRAIRLARDVIDLTRHQGEHPRMGATDVVPFVPVEGVTMEDCVQLARRLGERVGRELDIPVFLYARAATRAERERLPDVRKGEFEGLRDLIGTDPARAPDFGPARIHPTAGAVAIGARPFLVAYNIYLQTSDVTLAETIAKKIRTSSGGLPAVQARGFKVEGLAQVSMNLLDIDMTSPVAVFTVVRAEAAAQGVEIAKSEIVGLVPERALWSAGADALKLVDAPESHLLEARVRSTLAPPLDSWIDRLASADPTPGGGSAAALAATLAAALLGMVGRLTVGRKAYAEVEQEFRDLTTRADTLRMELRRLVDEDAAVFDRVSAAYKLPKTTEAERTERTRATDQALLEAARVPGEVARFSAEVAGIALRASEAGNKNAASDAAVAAALALAAARGAIYNVEINVAGLSHPDTGTELIERARTFGRVAEEVASAAEAAARGRIKS
jgi:glutamate formiminotransferase/formiminotetrahydrofolate cyclodeaminase